MHAQDPEFKARALWEGMAIVRPWDEIPAEVLAMEPHIYEETSTRNSNMSDEQKEVFQVGSVLVVHTSIFDIYVIFILQT